MEKWSDEEVDDLLDELPEDPFQSAKTGRRARKEPEPSTAAVPDVADDGMGEDLAAMETKPSDGPPKPSRRMSGWGAESSSGSKKGRRRNMDDDDDDERLRPRTPQKDDDSDEEPDIPVIPELDDNQEEDLTAQVAMAPNVAVNRVATYRELDNDLLRHAAFLTLDNEIDLKLLSKGLSAESDVQEEDKPWEWDRLFTEVSSELLTEWERKEVAAEEETAAAAS